MALGLLGGCSAVQAHTGARGVILLLPTGYVIAGGAVVVAATFVLVAAFRPEAVRRLYESASFALPRLRGVRSTPVAGALGLAATGILVVLIVAGFAGSRDPFENPLPLAVWTLGWVGLAFVHAVLGYVWPTMDPWTLPSAVLRRGLSRLSPAGSSGADAPLRYPAALGAWPSVVLLLLFAWFELVYPAPFDPAVLAEVLVAYSAWVIAGRALFGESAWQANAEIVPRFLRMVSGVAPVRTRLEPAPPRWVLGLPGARLASAGPRDWASVAFVIVALATVSFDGLSRTFWWLDLIGENPLEHPGRSALIGRSTLGLLAAVAILFLAFVIAAWLGARLAAGSPVPWIRRAVVSIVPIAFGYHFAHYLPVFLVDAQYAVVSLSDPFARGWNLLGTGDLHVTASWLTHHASIEKVWYAQVAAIVLAHVVAVVVLHAHAAEIRESRGAIVASQLPMTVLMIAYTLFGLWLLSAPVAA